MCTCRQSAFKEELPFPEITTYLPKIQQGGTESQSLLCQFFSLLSSFQHPPERCSQILMLLFQAIKPPCRFSAQQVRRCLFGIGQVACGVGIVRRL